MQARAAAFAREKIAPNVEAWERAGRYPRAAVAASGLTGLFCPAELGGAALGYPEGMRVFEELGRADASLAFSLSMHNAVAAAVCAHVELAAAWGRRLVAGEALGGFSLTEPHAGSDATAITTSAVETSAGWRVSGRKAWVSLSGEADLFLIVCKTSTEPGHSDVAILAVERAAAGVSFPVRYRTAASAFLPIGEMQLDSAPAMLLAAPGEGMRAALAAIDVARCDIAAIATGVQAAVLDAAVAYAAERRAFGVRTLELGAVQAALADVATDLEASRLLHQHAAACLGTPAGPVAVAHAKRFCADAAVRAAITCGQAMGAAGWLLDHAPARILPVARMLTMVDGTSEIQRVVIGRDLLRRALRHA
jgi:alkylation response protein AidB-like acyl-CoA dehydrogenase